MARIERLVINLLLGFALCLLLVGMYAPLLELEKFWVFSSQVSLYSSLLSLWQKHEFFLFILLFLFSVLTPLLKLGVLTLIANQPDGLAQQHGRLLHWMETFGRWSMLDVFVVALLLVSVKLGVVATVRLHYGIYLFAAAVLLIQGLSFWLARRSATGKNLKIRSQGK
ncbi:MAG: paraquat-inducible protein A [Thiothrix sp.]|nr:paraquat-inducible protein A [Thiothrix sp.]HPQ94416.1 paraquat-inducible protein A [Thiolinea sp.]